MRRATQYENRIAQCLPDPKHCCHTDQNCSIVSDMSKSCCSKRESKILLTATRVAGLHRPSFSAISVLMDGLGLCVWGIQEKIIQTHLHCSGYTHKDGIGYPRLSGFNMADMIVAASNQSSQFSLGHVSLHTAPSYSLAYFDIINIRLHLIHHLSPSQISPLLLYEMGKIR